MFAKTNEDQTTSQKALFVTINACKQQTHENGRRQQHPKATPYPPHAGAILQQKGATTYSLLFTLEPHLRVQIIVLNQGDVLNYRQIIISEGANYRLRVIFIVPPQLALHTLEPHLRVQI